MVKEINMVAERNQQDFLVSETKDYFKITQNSYIYINSNSYTDLILIIFYENNKLTE